MHFENVKVFDMRNPNFKINNSIEEIVDLFRDNHIPIIEKLNDNEFINCNEKVIGFTTAVSNYNENEIFADIAIWNEFREYSKIDDVLFKNYRVSVDNMNKETRTATIINIDAIEFKMKFD